MLPKRRASVRKGSWRWAARVAELTAWGTAAVILVVLHLSTLPGNTYQSGILLLGGLAIWLAIFFRVLLERYGTSSWVAWAGVFVDLAFAAALFYVLRGNVPSAHLLFVPVIVATGLIGTLVTALVASVIAVGAFFGVASITGGVPELVESAFSVGMFLLSGSVAGLLASELRSHYRGEQEEHRIAIATRHRLFAVLDAVDEGIVYRDSQGVARVVNQRAAELFDLDAGDFIGAPVVELLRTLARRTEDPEGFMEGFQSLLDEPEAELRVDVDQIMPARRNLKLYSGPTFDDDGRLVGRIDVYTDVTETVRRAQEVAEAYDQARKTAESYQRSLLPDAPPSLPRVSMVAHYLPAAGQRAVCGDFYDFIALPNGRVALVLGDVCGTGPRAANDAALTRYTLRSLVNQTQDPGELMSLVNSQIFRQSSSERFVRLLIAVLDPERATLAYANGGHVPPVLFRSISKEVEWLGEGGLVLGVESDSEYKIGETELAAGDMLVLYTDGITEAPRHGRPFGQGKFTDIVSDYGLGTPGELAQALRRSLEAWVGEGELRDDLAMVVCQVAPDRTLGEPARELVLPNEPARVPEMRSFVGGFLGEIRAPVEVSSEILLAVGEAAANASRHGRREQGRSEVRLHCALEGPSVAIAIADDGPGFDPSALNVATLPDRFASGGRGLFLMRTLMDEVEVDSSSEGTTVTLFRRIFGTRPS
jgi:serine phosphatase RsbU (regulator of sigma subunit)/anti-sigma regulatory factor (Ser/Thr protein kinase)